MRARLVVNPTSGANRSTTLLPLVTERLRSRVHDLVVTVTNAPQDAIRAGIEARRDGVDAVYVAGGDGTLNLVLRGLLEGDTRSDIPIGVLPFGTGNDFARSLGLGVNPEEALDHLLAMNVIAVDLGMLNDRPFVNASAGGYIADVSSLVTEGLKDATGKLAYLIGGVRALFESQPFTATVIIEDGASAGGPQSSAVDLQMLAVCNARTMAGGHVIAPGARIDDGVADAYLVRQLPTMEFISVLQRMATVGLDDDERIWHFRTRDLRLRFNRVVRVNADGEPFETDECHYRLLPRAVRFFCGPEPYAVERPQPWTNTS